MELLLKRSQAVDLIISDALFKHPQLRILLFSLEPVLLHPRLLLLEILPNPLQGKAPRLFLPEPSLVFLALVLELRLRLLDQC